MKKMIEWLENRYIYAMTLSLCIVFLLLAVVLCNENEYWGKAALSFGFAFVILIAFRNSTKPIRPYGERDNLKKMLSMAGKLELYRDITGTLSVVLLALGIVNVILGALTMLILVIFK